MRTRVTGPAGTTGGVIVETTGREGWHWAVRAGGLNIGTHTVQPEHAGCTAT